MPLHVADDFNRGSGADLGANWTPLTGESAMKLEGSACAPSSGGQDCTEYWNANTFSADQFSQATLTVIATTELGTGMGVSVRAATGAQTHYRLVGSTQGTRLNKFVTGSSTELATDGTVWANNDVMYLSVVGEFLTVRRNGAPLFTANDASIGSGRPAVTHSSVTDVGGVTLDNWSGGDIANNAVLPNPSHRPAPFRPGLAR